MNTETAFGVLHTLTPVGVAMAGGADEFDPYH